MFDVELNADFLMQRFPVKSVRNFEIKILLRVLMWSLSSQIVLLF